MDKKLLDPYIFKFNSFLNVWTAATRENYNELHSGDKGNVLKSENINVLTDLIMKTGGDKQKIEALLEPSGFHKEYPI